MNQVHDRRSPGRRRSARLHHRRGRIEPRSRPRPGEAAHRGRRRGGRRRGQVPDLHRRTGSWPRPRPGRSLPRRHPAARQDDVRPLPRARAARTSGTPSSRPIAEACGHRLHLDALRPRGGGPARRPRREGLQGRHLRAVAPAAHPRHRVTRQADHLLDRDGRHRRGAGRPWTPSVETGNDRTSSCSTASSTTRPRSPTSTCAPSRRCARPSACPSAGAITRPAGWRRSWRRRSARPSSRSTSRPTASRPGPDHRFALEPDELAAMVRAIRDAQAALGDGVKRMAPAEADLYVTARRIALRGPRHRGRARS